ncbi:UDP-N-acetyl-D-glucosamine dehydrogenase [candidate division WOR-3 bacterium]|uniref:UDP-N-acetyl-D-glucosamine dehydrogenase n=1 Tax=candidate division WOR-3 bacterium TaxID=2052148 RepID=A0A660SM64_UNCW3|nr:MAG: UDP-N-acetyl-D-glucosamine dehydrogenase [candidate division WOR-3 bacterium]
MCDELLKKIAAKEVAVSIIGLGYVGLPLASAIVRAGITTIGIDIDEVRVRMINEGRSPVSDVPDEELKGLLKRGFLASGDYDRIKETDVIIVCVPTPVTRSKDPDLTYLIGAGQGIGARLRRGQLVILKSTTFPQTTEGVFLPLLEKSGLKVGKDFFLAFCPERVDPGNRRFNIENTPIVIGGVTDNCQKAAVAFYKLIVPAVHPVSSPQAAEMTKLLENVFRNVNIALVNELAILCERMGLDIWEVIEAASTKPFGFMPFYPGPGVGGHCIPIDPYYLSWKAREFDYHIGFIELAARINENMPYHVAQLITEILGKRGIGLKKAKVLIVGVTFKPDVADTRHSPALKLIEIIQDKVGWLGFHDPLIGEVIVGRRRYRSVDLEQTLKEIDLAVIITNHSQLDYERVVSEAPLVLDTRNGCKGITAENVFSLGRPILD